MIKKATLIDVDTVTSLALELWPSHSFSELKTEFDALLVSTDIAIFLVGNIDEAIGFAEVSIRRDYVEGTTTSPVGYLEGIYIKPSFQHQGYGRQLVAACEKWAKEQHCLEFASDCELVNNDSILFHQKCGFSEVNRIVNFTKKL